MIILYEKLLYKTSYKVFLGKFLPQIISSIPYIIHIKKIEMIAP